MFDRILKCVENWYKQIMMMANINNVANLLLVNPASSTTTQHLKTSSRSIIFWRRFNVLENGSIKFKTSGNRIFFLSRVYGICTWEAFMGYLYYGILRFSFVFYLFLKVDFQSRITEPCYTWDEAFCHNSFRLSAINYCQKEFYLIWLQLFDCI